MLAAPQAAGVFGPDAHRCTTSGWTLYLLDISRSNTKVTKLLDLGAYSRFLTISRLSDRLRTEVPR